MLQVLLPDMELIVNLGDWPLNKKDRQPAFPVFSWCGSEDTRDIIWPTWDLMKATIMGMDRWVLVCCKEGGILLVTKFIPDHTHLILGPLPFPCMVVCSIVKMNRKAN